MAEDNPTDRLETTDAVLVLCNFVFSTTGISALKIYTLERDGFTGEEVLQGLPPLSQWECCHLLQ